MIKRFGASALFLGVFSASAIAASGLPPVKTSERNAVPACATPGRMMALLRERNPKLDPRFETIAQDYMRAGNDLGMRWDYGFFQMIVETGGLSFNRDGRSGDVRAEQNNFAGIGATGKGERGERFKDVASGVTAHLQHVMIYAGEKISDPISERTRKVQEWGVLNSWQKTIKGPITFAELARRWAPGADDYGRNIEQVAKRFYDDHCNRPDPAPELVADATSNDGVTEKVSGAEIARQSIAAARAEATSSRRSGLGAGNLARGAQPAEPATEGQLKPSVNFTVLNAPKAEATDAASIPPAVKPGATSERPAVVQQTSAPALAKGQPPVPAAQAGKCRVWQASYGGQRAIIIRSKSDGFTNFTVLDVNEGIEKREAEAYIQAYAKGGETVGEFNNQTLALDKAFDLCPEG